MGLKEDGPAEELEEVVTDGVIRNISLNSRKY